MPTSNVSYVGKLGTKCTHVQSGSTIFTDAPVDNNGNGANFSPTDLLATSFASCMLTVMGISAQNHGIQFSGADAEVTKTMASGPRRVVKIQVEMRFPDSDYTEKEKEILKKAALSCPVAQSLHPDIEQVVSFNFGQS